MKSKPDGSVDEAPSQPWESQKRQKACAADDRSAGQDRLTYQSLRKLEQQSEPFSPFSLLDIPSVDMASNISNAIPQSSQPIPSTALTTFSENASPLMLRCHLLYIPGLSIFSLSSPP